VADAVDLKAVTCGRELKLFAHATLHGFHLSGKELDGITANSADHMVMVAAMEAMLVAGNAIAEFNLRGQPAVGKEFQGTVHSGVADSWVVLFHEAVQIFRGEMIMGCKKNAQNCIPLRTLFEPQPDQMLTENALRIFQHRFGCVCFIIDTHFAMVAKPHLLTVAQLMRNKLITINLNHPPDQKKH
jgi:hypothetical protein